MDKNREKQVFLVIDLRVSHDEYDWHDDPKSKRRLMFSCPTNLAETILSNSTVVESISKEIDEMLKELKDATDVYLSLKEESE